MFFLSLSKGTYLFGMNNQSQDILGLETRVKTNVIKKPKWPSKMILHLKGCSTLLENFENQQNMGKMQDGGVSFSGT